MLQSTLIILLLQLILIQQIQCITLQDPTRFLKNKLDAKLDTNPYFIRILDNKEYNKHYTCNFNEGPYCSLLSNQTYYSIEDTFITYNLRTYLKEKMFQSNIQIEGHLQKQNSFLPSYYYLDKTRALLDEEIFYKPIEKKYPFRLLIDFNVLETLDEQSTKNELNINYLVGFNNGVQVISASPTVSKEYLTIKFKNFQYFSPKKAMDYKQSQQYIDRIDELNAEPNMVYLNTNSVEGTIEFNYPVKIQSFYAKPNLKSFEAKQYFQVKGYDQNMKLIFDNAFQFFHKKQDFYYKYVLDKNYTVSIITFSRYLQIDNLLLHVDRSHVLELPQLYLVESDSSPSVEVQNMIKSFDNDQLVITTPQGLNQFESVFQNNNHNNMDNNHNENNFERKQNAVKRLTKEDRRKQINEYKKQLNTTQSDLLQKIQKSQNIPFLDEKSIQEQMKSINDRFKTENKKDVVEDLLKLIDKNIDKIISSNPLLKQLDSRKKDINEDDEKIFDDALKEIEAFSKKIDPDNKLTELELFEAILKEQEKQQKEKSKQNNKKQDSKSISKDKKDIPIEPTKVDPKTTNTNKVEENNNKKQVTTEKQQINQEPKNTNKNSNNKLEKQDKDLINKLNQNINDLFESNPMLKQFDKRNNKEYQDAVKDYLGDNKSVEDMIKQVEQIAKKIDPDNKLDENQLIHELLKQYEMDQIPDINNNKQNDQKQTNLIKDNNKNINQNINKNNKLTVEDIKKSNSQDKPLNQRSQASKESEIRREKRKRERDEKYKLLQQQQQQQQKQSENNNYNNQKQEL